MREENRNETMGGNIQRENLLFSVCLSVSLWNHIQKEFNRRSAAKNCSHRSEPSFPEHCSERGTTKEAHRKWEGKWKITLHVSAIKHEAFELIKGFSLFLFITRNFKYIALTLTLEQTRGFSRNSLLQKKQAKALLSPFYQWCSSKRHTM
jgi:hypothetical protein